MSSALPHLTPVARVDRPVIPDTAKLFLYPAEDHIRPYEPSAPDLLPDALRLTPERRAALVAAFGSYLGKPQHPLLAGLQLIDWLCATCQPAIPRAAALRAHGRAGLLLWRQYNIVGRVMTAAMPLMGLDRIFTRLPQNMATLSNFGTRWVGQAAPGHWYLVCTDDPTPPEYVAGMLDVLSEFSKVPDLAIHWTTPDSHKRVYEVEWRV